VNNSGASGPEIDVATVAISVSGCGFAAATSGTGIVLSPGRVLTSAHVVAQADQVMVTGGTGVHKGVVVALDLAADLALIDAPDVAAETESPVVYGLPAKGADVVVTSVTDNGEVVATSTSIVDVVPIRIQEVLGTDRHTRAALSLEAASSDGESGGGVWSIDGRLVGVVFGHTTSEPERGWATSSSVIEAFLAEATPAAWTCDSRFSRLVNEQT